MATTVAQALALSEACLKQATKAANDGFHKVAASNSQIGIGWALYAQAKTLQPTTYPYDPPK